MPLVSRKRVETSSASEMGRCTWRSDVHVLSRCAAAGSMLFCAVKRRRQLRQRRDASLRAGDRLTVRPEIRNVELQKRAYFYSQCPEPNVKLPEIAFFGQSNVGKSSLINALCGKRVLSTTSKHPGHTKLIHHFLCENSFYLVDLPGTGYAEGKGRQLKQMSNIVAAYVRHRETLVELFYLIDSSKPIQDMDLEGVKWLIDSGVFVTIILTKGDKVRRNFDKKDLRRPFVELLQDALHEMPGSPWRLGTVKNFPLMFETSATTRWGREAILEHIADIRKRVILGRKQKRQKKDQPQESLSPPPGIR
eukprot:TRINITY_DN94824_c0_g1_i1.p1 TRINITY_DN94824_c0_g1~~TRINITY_DN94824_c0_g1_i1.p1  ORF type:complete len:347 (-),score=51.16 TRINITY_DN94824_c0_g1_i1:9-926(-)